MKVLSDLLTELPILEKGNLDMDNQIMRLLGYVPDLLFFDNNYNCWSRLGQKKFHSDCSISTNIEDFVSVIIDRFSGKVRIQHSYNIITKRGVSAGELVTQDNMEQNSFKATITLTYYRFEESTRDYFYQKSIKPPESFKIKVDHKTSVELAGCMALCLLLLHEERLLNNGKEIQAN